MAVPERDDPEQVETSTERPQPEAGHSRSGAIRPNDIDAYKVNLARLSDQVESVEKVERILGSRNRTIQQERQNIINYSTKKQIDHKIRQANFLLIQQAAARLISISVGLYLLILSDVYRSLYSHPVGILFLLLGLSGPLGYIFSEINQLLERLPNIAKFGSQEGMEPRDIDKKGEIDDE